MSGDLVQDKALLTLGRSDGFFEFDLEECKAVGTSLHDSYTGASPFPHVVIEQFVDPTILEGVVRDFPDRGDSRFADQFSRLKTGYSLSQIRSAYIQDFLNALNSAAFLAFLEKMTGIKGLVADPYFAGGGLHETARGGHLSIHADFNIHPKTKMLRRLNLILFLNEDWQADYGGGLELWDREMKGCEKSVLPIMNRAVVFNTDSTSYHGHPDPLTCPDTVFRRSIALYYYTVPQGSGPLPHTTLFKARAGSNDAPPGFNERVVKRLRSILKGKLN